MRKLSLLLICIFFINCSNGKKSFKLNEIGFDNQLTQLIDEECPSLEAKGFKDLFKYLEEEDDDMSYNKIMLINFSLSGDVTDLNTIVLFESKDGESRATIYDYPWQEGNGKAIDEFNFEDFENDISSSIDGTNTNIDAILIQSSGLNCFSIDKFSFEKYQNLKNLSYFN